MWPIQLDFFLSILCRKFLCSSTFCNTLLCLTRSVHLIFSIFLQHHISKLSNYFWSTFRSVPVSAPQKATLQIQQFARFFLKIESNEKGLLVGCCFCHESRVYNFPCTSCIICCNAVHTGEIFHTLRLFLFSHNLFCGWLPCHSLRLSVSHIHFLSITSSNFSWSINRVLMHPFCLNQWHRIICTFRYSHYFSGQLLENQEITEVRKSFNITESRTRYLDS